MASFLSQEQLSRYAQDGFLSPLTALTPHEAAGLLGELEAQEASRSGRLPALFNAKPHLLVRSLWNVVRDPRILDCVESILGPDLLCWGSTFIPKPPRDTITVAWHQDLVYWGLSQPDAVTVWLALTPSAAESGCVLMIPGSHRKVQDHTGRSSLLREQLGVDAVDERQAVDLDLTPGQMSIHHSMTVHGSGANRSDYRRVGFVIRYVPGHAIQKEARISAALVRGRDLGNFDLEQEPEADFHADAVRRHAEVIRRMTSAVSHRYFLGLTKTQRSDRT
jgi:hypothetical protein